MNTTGYLRVSSRAQDHASQRAAIERAAAVRGDVVTNWYAEKRSGRSWLAPSLTAFGPAFDVVMCGGSTSSSSTG